jgi:hypothetical protein
MNYGEHQEPTSMRVESNSFIELLRWLNLSFVEHSADSHTGGCVVMRWCCAVIGSAVRIRGTRFFAAAQNDLMKGPLSLTNEGSAHYAPMGRLTLTNEGAAHFDTMGGLRLNHELDDENERAQVAGGRDSSLPLRMTNDGTAHFDTMGGLSWT